MAASLKVAGQWLTLDRMVNAILPGTLTENEAHAIKFCKNWLTGVQHFQFETSGSTGIPKKIIFHRDQLLTSARMTLKALGVSMGCTSLICLDTRFIAGAMMLIRGIEGEMKMVLQDPSSNPLQSVDEQIDFAAIVPLQLISLLEDELQKLNQLKWVLVGGAPLDFSVIEKLRDLHPQFYATYGMTETLSHVALQKLNGDFAQNFFELLPGITAGTDERSCLVLQVPFLGEDTIRTNDVVNMMHKTAFQWIGRYDRVINSGGVKVQAEKVERILNIILNKQGINRRFFVSGQPHKTLGQQVELFIEGKNLSAEAEREIISHAQVQLEKFEIPRIIRYVDQFIMTSTQKVDRYATLKLLHLGRTDEQQKL